MKGDIRTRITQRSRKRLSGEKYGKQDESLAKGMLAGNFHFDTAEDAEMLRDWARKVLQKRDGLAATV